MPAQADVDAFLPPLEPRQVLDPADRSRSGRWSGPRRSWRCATSRMPSSRRRWMRSPNRGRVQAGVRPRAAAGWCAAIAARMPETIVVALGSVVGTIRTRSTNARADGDGGSAFSASGLVPPFPLAAVRATLLRAQRVVVLEKACSVGLGGVVSTDVRVARCRACRCTATTVSPDSAGARSPSASLAHDAARGGRRPAAAADLPWTWTGASCSVELERESAPNAAADRSPRTCCATARSRRKDERAMNADPIKFYQTGTFTVGNRLLAPGAAQRAGERRTHELAQQRPPPCQGLRRGARRALRGRRGDARDRTGSSSP